VPWQMAPTVRARIGDSCNGRQALRGKLADRAVQDRHHNSCNVALPHTHFIARASASVGDNATTDRRDVLSLGASVAHRRSRRFRTPAHESDICEFARTPLPQEGEA
jgi:hypothetical protein